MTIAMQVIAAGAGIDYILAYLLTHILSADPKTGMAMYMALSGGASKRAALNAAAEARMSPEDYLLFRAVMMCIGPARNIRNAFAHHLWAYSEELPDAALLVDPECMVNFDIGVKMVNRAMEQRGIVILPPGYDVSQIYVYRKADLDEILVAANEASANLVTLALDLQLYDGSVISGPARLQLLTKPPIAQALERLTRQNTQAGQTPQPQTPPAL